MRKACGAPAQGPSQRAQGPSQHAQALSQHTQGLYNVRKACAGPVYVNPARDLAESRENSDQKLRVLIGRLYGAVRIRVFEIRFRAGQVPNIRIYPHSFRVPPDSRAFAPNPGLIRPDSLGFFADKSTHYISNQ